MASTALSVDAVRLKETLRYDEAISYLAASCHQKDYSELSFDVLPRPGSYWKQFVNQIEQPLCFGQIAEGLGHHDIHPPLYFWLLHVWLLLVGVHIWSGPLLNSFITILTIAILTRFVAERLRDRTETILVILTFALNPSVLLVSLEARQYTLLSLWTVLFVWQTIQYVNGHRLRERLAFIGGVIVLGLLTHYQFLIVMFGGILFAAARLLPDKHRQFSLFLLFSVLAAVLAFQIHPYFFSSFQRQISANPGRGLSEWLIRLDNVFTALITFSYLIPAFVLVLALGWMEARRRREAVVEYLARVDRRGISILFFALWVTGAVIAQYLAFLSPLHAIGSPKYLSIAWPFLPILVVFLWRMGSHRKSLLLYLVAVPILLAFLFPITMRIYNTSDMSPIRDRSELIVVDNPSRGLFLQVARFLPDDASVIVDTQEDLIAHAERWLPYVGSGALYISDT